MSEMSEKPIHRFLNVLSILTLVYYTATSIHSLIQCDAILPGPEAKTTLEPPMAQLQAHRTAK